MWRRNDVGRLDLPTVTAISITAFFLLNVVFWGAESAACWQAGCEVRGVSLAGVREIPAEVSVWQARLVQASATIALLLASLAALGLFRSFPQAPPTVRYFLWLSAALNGLAGATYLAASIVLDAGRWADFTRGLQPAVLWKLLITAAGVALAYFLLESARRLAEVFLGRDPDQRDLRARLLTWTPYLTAGVLSVAGALAASANGPRPLLSGALWGFGVTALLVVIPWMARLPTGQTPYRGLPLPRSCNWLLAGALSAALFVGLFGFAAAKERPGAGAAEGCELPPVAARASRL